MTKKKLTGAVHSVPADLRRALASSKAMRATWDDITPLARTEWICWIISPKKAETRKVHMKRARSQLVARKRRPCCWAGCPHR